MGKLRVDTEAGHVWITKHAEDRWLERGDGRSLVDAIQESRRLRIDDRETTWLSDGEYVFPVATDDMAVTSAMTWSIAASVFRKKTGRRFVELPEPPLPTATITEIRRWLDLPADVVLIAAAGKSKSSIAVANKIAALKRAAEPKQWRDEQLLTEKHVTKPGFDPSVVGVSTVVREGGECSTSGLPPIKLVINQPEGERPANRRGWFGAIKRFWFGAAVVAIVSAVGCVAPVETGKVIAKEYQPSKSWVTNEIRYVPGMDGKIDARIVPVSHHRPERFILTVEGEDSYGETKTQQVFVDQQRYERLEVGDAYIRGMK